MKTLKSIRKQFATEVLGAIGIIAVFMFIAVFPLMLFPHSGTLDKIGLAVLSAVIAIGGIIVGFEIIKTYYEDYKEDKKRFNVTPQVTMTVDEIEMLPGQNTPLTHRLNVQGFIRYNDLKK